MINEDEYNELQRIKQNAEYMYKMNMSIQQAKEGKVVVKTMEELEVLADAETSGYSTNLNKLIDDIVSLKADSGMTLKEGYENFYGRAYEDIDFSKEVEEVVEFGESVGEEI